MEAGRLVGNQGCRTVEFGDPTLIENKDLVESDDRTQAMGCEASVSQALLERASSLRTDNE